MTRGEQFAAELAAWDRTPFEPQQSAKGRGADCKGLMWGAARELNFPEAASFYATFIGYKLDRRNGLPHEMFPEGMAALFDRVQVTVEGTDRQVKLIGAQPGDLLLLKMDRKPCHLAAVSLNEGKAWHAQIGSNNWTKEASLRSLLKKFDLHSAWRWRCP